MFSFVVSLNYASTAKGTVKFATASGTASSGRNGDSTATSGTPTFNPVETSTVVSVSVMHDTVVEADETFFVKLSSASGAAISSGTGTIVNEDGVVTHAILAAFALHGISADAASATTPKRNP